MAERSEPKDPPDPGHADDLGGARPSDEEPSKEEKFDVPPETAKEIDDGEEEKTADQIFGESSWLRSSG